MIRTKCSECQCICEYKPGAIRSTFWTDGRFAYDFFCLKCKRYQRHWATAAQAKELTDAGVLTEVVDVPKEWVERGESKDLLTTVDHADFVIDLHYWDGCLTELDVAGS